MRLYGELQHHHGGTDQTVGCTVLVTLGLPHEPSAFVPARDPPQAELAWDDACSGCGLVEWHVDGLAGLTRDGTTLTVYRRETPPKTDPYR